MIPAFIPTLLLIVLVIVVREYIEYVENQNNRRDETLSLANERDDSGVAQQDFDTDGQEN